MKLKFVTYLLALVAMLFVTSAWADNSIGWDNSANFIHLYGETEYFANTSRVRDGEKLSDTANLWIGPMMELPLGLTPGILVGVSNQMADRADYSQIDFYLGHKLNDDWGQAMNYFLSHDKNEAPYAEYHVTGNVTGGDYDFHLDPYVYHTFDGSSMPGVGWDLRALRILNDHVEVGLMSLGSGDRKEFGELNLGPALLYNIKENIDAYVFSAIDLSEKSDNWMLKLKFTAYL